MTVVWRMTPSVVVEERVHAVLALLERAVSAVVHGVALAAHGLVLVPEVVRVRLLDGRAEVLVVGRTGDARAGHVVRVSVERAHLGELLDRLARAVARAIVGARGARARGARVAVEAVTLARLAVADALVRALHVGVALVGVGVRELLGGAPRVHLGAGHDGGQRARHEAVRVKVACDDGLQKQVEKPVSALPYTRYLVPSTGTTIE